MSRLTELPTRELLAAFASAAPTPGGGSAAALTASVGLSLLAMVAIDGYLAWRFRVSGWL